MIILSHVYRNLQAHTSVFPEHDLVKLTTSSLPRKTLAVERVSDLAGSTVCVNCTARNNTEGLSSFVVLVVCHPSQRAVGKA